MYAKIIKIIDLNFVRIVFVVSLENVLRLPHIYFWLDIFKAKSGKMRPFPFEALHYAEIKIRSMLMKLV